MKINRIKRKAPPKFNPVEITLVIESQEEHESLIAMTCIPNTISERTKAAYGFTKVSLINGFLEDLKKALV